jgi:tetratricopeptide (TPR) repeat protein
LLLYNHALYTTWNLSFKHIQSQNESAEKLLQLWAYFDNQDIWFQLWLQEVRAVLNGSLQLLMTSCFIKATRLLCDHTLIEPLEVSDEYSMYTCVHAWAVHVLNAEREISMARLALICVDSAVPAKNVPKYWVKEQRLLLHVSKCFESIHDVIDLESQDDWNTLSVVHNLEKLYHNQGKMVEAESMYQQALKSYEKTWGSKHTFTLSTVNNLELLYSDQGKMVEAKAMYWRARNEKY